MFHPLTSGQTPTQHPGARRSLPGHRLLRLRNGARPSGPAGLLPPVADGRGSGVTRLGGVDRPLMRGEKAPHPDLAQGGGRTVPSCGPQHSARPGTAPPVTPAWVGAVDRTGPGSSGEWYPSVLGSTGCTPRGPARYLQAGEGRPVARPRPQTCPGKAPAGTVGSLRCLRAGHDQHVVPRHRASLSAFAETVPGLRSLWSLRSLRCTRF